MLTFSARGLIFAQGADDSDLRVFAQDAVKARVVFYEVLSALTGGEEGVCADDPGRAGDPRLEHARDIALAHERAAKRAEAVTLFEIVTEDPRPDEAIEVEVDDVGGEVDLDGLLRDAERAGPSPGFISPNDRFSAHLASMSERAAPVNLDFSWHKPAILPYVLLKTIVRRPRELVSACEYVDECVSACGRVKETLMFSHPDEAKAREGEREARALAERHPGEEIAILGAPGSPAGLGLTILASIFARHVHLLAPDMKDATAALERASKMARSHVVRDRGRAHELGAGLEEALKEATIVFLLAPEPSILEQLPAALREDALLFIDPYEGSLAACLEAAPALKERAIGLRFFGPPHLTTGAELLRSPELDSARFELGAAILRARFGLLAVEVRDCSLGLARRLETKLLNEAAKLAEAYPIALIDGALGGETGRPRGALTLLDAIGWESHRRRANLLSEEAGDARLRTPSYMSGEGSFFQEGEDGARLALDLPSNRHLPLSSFDTAPLAIYRAMSELIEVGKYAEALETLMNASGDFPKLTRELLAAHLVEAFGAVASGEVASVQELDRLVGAALGWIPPGALVDLIGPERTRALITEAGLGVPDLLKDLKDGERLHHDPRLSPGAYFHAQPRLKG